MNHPTLGNQHQVVNYNSSVFYLHLFCFLFLNHQVLHDRSQFTTAMNDWFFCAMGSWHTYKIACAWVWKMYSPFFLGPMFHYLHPAGHFKREDKHSTIQLWLTRMRLAYPAIKDELVKAIDECKVRDRNLYNHLLNLRGLFEYFIPTVSCILLYFFFIVVEQSKVFFIVLYLFFAEMSIQRNDGVVRSIRLMTVRLECWILTDGGSNPTAAKIVLHSAR